MLFRSGVSLRAERQLGEIGLVPEGSMARNSLASQEFGSDWTSPFQRRQLALRLDLPPMLERRWRLSVEVATERHSRVTVHATPARGEYEPTSFIGTDAMVRDRIIAYRAAGVTSLRLQPMGRTPAEKLDTLAHMIDLVREVDSDG